MVGQMQLPLAHKQVTEERQPYHYPLQFLQLAVVAVVQNKPMVVQAQMVEVVDTMPLRHKQVEHLQSEVFLEGLTMPLVVEAVAVLLLQERKVPQEMVVMALPTLYLELPFITEVVAGAEATTIQELDWQDLAVLVVVD